jgi:hypothetical protein
VRICPYTKLHPLTKQSGEANGFQFIELKDGDHYFRILKEHWLLQETLITLEHDNYAWGIPELESCPHLWCVRPYYRRLTDHQVFPYSLGLTKFSSQLMRGIPDLFDRVEKLTPDPRNWKNLDVRIVTMLLVAGFDYPHEHKRTIHFR